ncbi:MAG: hypothetical protein H6810_00580 [Phycisphaeraceae bacterium]|nr:MAG: hypothetical protein H6810_00580 [Phycisphaeraceae bacterium]
MHAGFTTLAVIDGQKAWEQVCAEISRTLDDPLRGLPLVAGVVLIIVVLWANFRVARWLTSTKDAAPEGRPAQSAAHRKTDGPTLPIM